MGKCDELKKFCNKSEVVNLSIIIILYRYIPITKEKIFVIYIYTFVHYLYWIEKEFINERQTAIVVYYM